MYRSKCPPRRNTSIPIPIRCGKIKRHIYIYRCNCPYVPVNANRPHYTTISGVECQMVPEEMVTTDRQHLTTNPADRLCEPIGRCHIHSFQVSHSHSLITIHSNLFTFLHLSRSTHSFKTIPIRALVTQSFKSIQIASKSVRIQIQCMN